MRRALAIAGLAAALAACAVIRVDVDVYKGPLANHEDVQIHQYAAMAIGAKPLLIQLRDSLEWPDEARRIEGRKATGYRPEFINEPPGRGYFQKDNARRVNAVLSLYSDLGHPGLAHFTTRGEDAIRVVLGNARILNPESGSPERRERVRDWNRWKQHFAPCQAGATCAHTPLIDQYRTFLGADGDKDGGKNIYPLIRVADQLDARSPALSPGEGKTRSTREMFAALAATGEEPDRLLEHAKIVFGLPNISSADSAPPEAREFIERVRSIALAYEATRVALEQMWLAAVDGMLYAYSAAYEKDPFPQPARKAAELIAELTHASHLSIARKSLDVAAPDCQAALPMGRPQPKASGAADGRWTLVEDCKAVWSILDRNLQDIYAFIDKGPTEEKCTRDLAREEAVRTGLQAAIESNPVFVSQWLKNLHQAYKTTPTVVVAGAKGCVARLLDRGARSSGLALRAATQDEDEISGRFEQVVDVIREIRNASAAGFERGRPAKGIEKLTEEYLELKDRPQPRSEVDRKAHLARTEEAREELRRSLIGFAEKVLTIANNEVLLAPAGAALETGLDRYVVVLQAVGNALLIQADELTHREAHKSGLRVRTGSELAAVEGVLRIAPRRAFDQLLGGVQAEAVSAEAERGRLVSAATAVDEELTAAKKVSDGLEQKLGACKPQQTQAETDLKSAKDAAKGILAAHGVLLGQDAERLKAKVAAADDVTTAKMVRDEIVVWTKAERDSIPVAGDARKTALGEAHDFLAGFDVANAPDGKRKEVFAGVADLFRRAKYEPARTQLANLEAAVEKKKSECAELDAGHKKAKEKTDGLAGDKKLAEKARDSAVGREAALASLSKWLNARRDGILPPAPSSTADRLPWIPPSEIYERAVAKLRSCVQSLDAGACALPGEAKADKAKLEAALAALEARNPPLDPASMDFGRLAKDREAVEGGKHAHAKAVLDDLIGLLRYEHIRAVYEGGAEFARVRQIEDSMKAAFDHRTGMAYIRPSAAYLRNSYPASSLQADPGLSWRNMLEEHALRNVPFLGQYNGYNAERAKITAEIDKQFWQNINSVRVAGGGDTNQVIAKDDVGNWYVKAYSGNPEKIFKSAKSLALFHLGGKFNSDLLARDARRQPGADGAAAAAAAAEPTTLERLFDRHRRVYEEATKAEYEAALQVNADRALVLRIQNAWKADVAVAPVAETLANAPVAAAGPLDAAIAAARGAKPADQPLKIVDIGEELRLYHRRVQSNLATALQGITVTADRDKAAPVARRLATEAIREEIGRIADRRANAIASYEQALLFLGEATQPPAPPLLEGSPGGAALSN